MTASMGEYYGHDAPSASYKWGVVIPGGVTFDKWVTVAWFKTRERAVTYARSGWNEFAICRLAQFNGRVV